MQTSKAYNEVIDFIASTCSQKLIDFCPSEQSKVNYHRGLNWNTSNNWPESDPAEKEILAHYLVEANGDQPSSEKPQSQRGDWADAFPQDFDVEAELKGIRGE
jgi:hypothetical protein